MADTPTGTPKMAWGGHEHMVNKNEQVGRSNRERIRKKLSKKRISDKTQRNNRQGQTRHTSGRLEHQNHGNPAKGYVENVHGAGVTTPWS